MSTLQKCAFLSLIAFGQIAFAQQSTPHSPKIICKPTLKILKMVRPNVSPDAKNILGTVTVKAEIDKTGRPSSVRILKGHPILAAAVLDAVRQWRWEPVILDGLPVEAETMITVNFEPR
jgi:TonB family protein